MKTENSEHSVNQNDQKIQKVRNSDSPTHRLTDSPSIPSIPKLLISALFTIYYLLFTVPHVYAFEIGKTFQPAMGAKAPQNFGDLFTTILTILISATGAISIFFIIIAGIKFVTASGDEKKMASASSTITYAIIGLAVTALAFIILQLVQTFLGSDVKIT